MTNNDYKYMQIKTTIEFDKQTNRPRTTTS